MWHVALADGLTLSHSFCGYQIHGENAKKIVNHHFSPVKYRKKPILQDPERLLCFLCSKQKHGLFVSLMLCPCKHHPNVSHVKRIMGDHG